MDEIVRTTCIYVLVTNKSCVPCPSQTHINRYGRFIGQQTNRKTHFNNKVRLLMAKPVFEDSSEGLAMAQATVGFFTFLQSRALSGLVVAIRQWKDFSGEIRFCSSLHFPYKRPSPIPKCMYT